MIAETGTDVIGTDDISDITFEPLTDNGFSSQREMDFETKYEKEPMNQAEFVGEFAPSLPADNVEEWEALSDVPFAGADGDVLEPSDTSWDSLSDVPFAGDVDTSTDIID